MNKPRLLLTACTWLMLATSLVAADLGPRPFTRADDPASRSALASLPLTDQIQQMSQRVTSGDLVLLRQQDDPLARMTHRTYAQVYRGLPVFGGEVVFHDQNGTTRSLTGKFFNIGDLSLTPTVPAETAAAAFLATLDPGRAPQLKSAPELIFYPLTDADVRLAYLMTYRDGREYSMSGVVDAHSGALLNSFANVMHDDEGAIGLGTGYHGEDVKLVTVLSGSKYYLADEQLIRPVNQYTYDGNLGGYIPTST